MIRLPICKECGIISGPVISGSSCMYHNNKRKTRCLRDDTFRMDDWKFCESFSNKTLCRQFECMHKPYCARAIELASKS